MVVWKAILWAAQTAALMVQSLVEKRETQMAEKKGLLTENCWVWMKAAQTVMCSAVSSEHHWVGPMVAH
jgi:hypothetical protein